MSRNKKKAETPNYSLSENDKRFYQQIEKRRSFKHYDFLLADLLSILLCFGISYYRKAQSGPLDWQRYLLLGAVLLGGFFLILAIWPCYSGILRRGTVKELQQTVFMNIDLYVIVSVVLLLSKTTDEYSREVISFFFILDTVLMFLARFLLKNYLHASMVRRKSRGELYLATTRRDAEAAAKRLLDTQDGSEFMLTGIILLDEEESREGESIHGIPVVANARNYLDVIVSNGVMDVFVHAKNVDADLFVSHMADLSVNTYRSVVSLGTGPIKHDLEQFSGFEVLATKTVKVPIGQRIVKRVLDIVLSAAALVLLSPIFVLLAVLIKKEDGGKVFYVSKRIGYHGKTIGVHKFRSMREDADNLEDMLTPEQLAQYKKEFKLDNDPRCTRIGAILRKTSMDELPQFFDVLIGKLSLVGPRPVTLEETYFYGLKRRLFLSVKPGLTGFWQARGRSNVTYESGERQSMELYYVENHSLLMDVKILFWTVKAVLTKDGAK